MYYKSFFKLLFVTILLGATTACSKDDDASEEQGTSYNTEVYLTDAPIDNSEVKGAFITVAEVKINGKALNNFQATTVEISSLTNGKSKLLGNLDLQAGSTSNISLVLSDTDDAGNKPGNYVLTQSGEKHALVQGSKIISVNDSAEILASGANKLILDMDLRKSIKSSSEARYTLASDSQLRSSIRAVNAQNAGAIAGSVSSSSQSSDKVVVFAYKSGSFNESEMDADAEGMRFANAVNSSVVQKSNGDFSLHFMEAGSYELHFASFSDKDNDGKLEFEGQLEVASTGSINLSSVQVEANSTVTLEVALKGLLNF